MTDFVLQVAVSNLCVSLLLASVAFAVHTTGKQPPVAHLLWLLVLAKLVTPPIVTIPVVPVSGLTTTTADLEPGYAGSLVADLPGEGGTIEPAGNATAFNAAATWLVGHGKTGLVLFWMFGSACVFVWSIVRIYRFSRLLKMAYKVAPHDLQRAATEIAQRLGLKATPTIYTTSAHLSPMVWWPGGRVRIVIPAALPDEMDAGQLRWILAHELAHVRRRDHLVRWLEWLACVCFWWNPVAWWARRNLRINEEICCDALVLSTFEPKPRAYANALMKVVEFLASPAIRPPAMASEINSGGCLERRFRMIMVTNPNSRTSRWLQAGILLMAVTLLPLGVAYARDHDDEDTKVDCEAIGVELKQMVTNGEMTEEAARERYEDACGDNDDSIEGHYRRLGMEGRDIEKIRNHFEENGLTDEQAEQALGGMLRVVHEMKSEGEAFELDPRLQDYFADEVGLTIEQVDMVQRIARRVRGTSEREDGMKRHMAGALSEGGIEREIIREVTGAMKKLVFEVKSEGKSFTVNMEMMAYLEQLGLTDEQIELVVGLSLRVHHAESRSDGDGIEERIEGAVERGDITRKEADAKYEEIKVRMAEQRAEEPDWEAITKDIEGAVDRGEMTREEADATYVEIKKKTALKDEDGAE